MDLRHPSDLREEESTGRSAPGPRLRIAPWILILFVPGWLVLAGEEGVRRTLTRTIDVPVVSGAMLEPLLGRPLSHLACLAETGRGMVPIPCQIDERTPSGDYVFPLGPEANPADGDGRLSTHDELVFAVRDAGACVTTPRFLSRAGMALELQILDPQDRGVACLYLVDAGPNPPRSRVDYVSYDPVAHQVDGRTYQLGYSSVAPIVFDRLVLKRSAGGTGQNSVDRMKVRLSAKVWDTIPIVKTEDDYSSTLVGYIDGPVRVLRRTRNRLVLFWKIPSPAAIQDNYFYPTFFEFPILVSLPFDLATFLSEAHLRISVDLQGDPQSAFVNSRNPAPTRLDGKLEPPERSLDEGPAAWSVIYGSQTEAPAAWFNRLSVAAGTPIRPDLYYGDDADRSDAPEREPGEVGDVGYQVRDLTGLKKGTHTLTSVLYSLPRFSPGMETELLAVRDVPLEITRTRIFPVR